MRRAGNICLVNQQPELPTLSNPYLRRAQFDPRPKPTHLHLYISMAILKDSVTADLKVAVMGFPMGYSKEDWRASEMDDSMVFLMVVLMATGMAVWMESVMVGAKESMMVQKTPDWMEAQMAA
jgi:hypothetical protein